MLFSTVCVMTWCLATGHPAGGEISVLLPSEEDTSPQLNQSHSVMGNLTWNNYTNCYGASAKQSFNGSEKGWRNPRIGDVHTVTLEVGAHRFHASGGTWYQARDTCVAEGGHLAIINSEAEANKLHDMFNIIGSIPRGYYSDLAFIGIQRNNTEGKWVTIFGEPLEKTGYTWYADGGGPTSYDRFGCGVFEKTGRLGGFHCGNKAAFICEIPIDD